ncbi:MAG TPA: sugar ABC transporter substrate-binding protein [Paenibacillus sp.]|uniref:Sugar ABC transporter substrate-binding protein n=2 Tax=Bacillales TaxID=1385 RepID=A0ABT8JHR0_9BACL|nr:MULTISPECIES: multiple monosaccharide ABC transporter substrate-binding protein [Paenibacillus]MDN4604670.1 sugar ABC transporter substrate-binding protein [Paenibacillus vandeheii]OZQ64920.1 sugar ABC transporter substrate-binding protein [Paenibacillus taichungensis]HBU80371.1 sugar ABC transporter substrate-binding protein [Paenibacillus sp.]
MKKGALFIWLLVMTLVLSACNLAESETGSKAKGYVGISMPTKSSERWVGDGENMVRLFQEQGYKTDLQYAEDVVENQISQIENMITKGVDVMVVASVDGNTLTDVIKKAHDQGIQIISYDRLIRNTPYLTYYATFDNFKVGVLQASYIEQKLGLKEGKGPYNIELFGGSPDDNNAYFFFDGAMSVLKPYMDSGKLVVRSKQMTMAQIATLRWDGALAQSRMDNLLSAYYSGDNLDAVLSPYDGISIGIISSLKGVGYGKANKPLPVITGQDAELASIKSIVAGEQTQTVFKDTRKLAEQTVEMANSILQGKPAEVNDEKSYNNGIKIIPAYLLDPISVDRTNVEKDIVGSQYYTKEEIGLK